jgi:hypothetical protein
MKDEELLSAIRDEARAERARALELERVARGEADGAALGDAERAAARPLEPAAAERIAAAVLRARAVAAKDTEPKRATVTPLRRRLVQLAGPLALAAVMVLYFATRSSPDAAPELPGYAVSVSGEKEMRGAADAPSSRLVLRGGPNARFEILARPAQAAPEHVAAYAFAVRGGDVASLDDAKVEVSKDGAVRVTGAARELEGASAVRLVIGAPRAITTFDDAVERARGQKNDAHTRIVDVVVERR